ncbi:MAG: hypothetical protein ACLFP8_07700 [Alphaproteobacteria bacterium]
MRDRKRISSFSKVWILRKIELADAAAAFAGYETPETYPFDPSLFPGYSHTNTNDDESALDEHCRFATWVFRLKK